MEANLERIKNTLEKLATYNATPEEGITRFSYTKEYLEAQEYLISEMQKLNMTIKTDGVGNVIGRINGLDNKLPAIAVGSHLDSVYNGGMFDGAAGIVAAIEVARVLKEKNFSNKHPIEVIALIEEEGGTFASGMFGGKVMSGNAKESDLTTLKNAHGISLKNVLESYGIPKSRLSDSARTKADMGAFIELHIEQGPVLEKENLKVGIVDSIVGMKSLEIVIEGRPDHAGTTPMNLRKDAMVTAAELTLKVKEAAESLNDSTVATVGKLDVINGAVNVVPGKVKLTVDIRSRNKESLVFVENEIRCFLENAKNTLEQDYTIFKPMEMDPVNLSSKLVRLLAEASQKRTNSARIMTSGAGHDSLMIASFTDVGMVFVPSKNGRSHCPEEWTDYEAIKLGTDVILDVIAELDKA